jgi:hypothetical protein
MPSWLASLLAPLRRIARRLKDAIRALLRRQRGPLEEMATMLLADHLPAPLAFLLRAFAGDRGFLFWWVVVTAALVGVLVVVLAVVLAPVTALIALIVVGVRGLAHKRPRRRAEDPLDGLRLDDVPDLVGAAT